jgi:site-specific recombinase XerD
MASEHPIQRYQAEITVGTESSGLDLLSAFLQRFDREQTRRAYRNDISHFFESEYVLLDDVRRVSFLHVNEYIARLEAAGLKATTIKRRIAALRGFFDWLLALELVERNPVNRQFVRRVRTVRRQDQTIFVLTAQQAEALLAATELSGEAAIRDRTLMTTMIHCVLRRSEAAAMDVEHIRPLGRYWVLDLPQTKGGADQYVKVPTHVVDEIEAMKSHYGITSGPLWRSFSPRSFGKRLTPHSIYRIVKQAAIRAGLSNSIGAHTLRHSGCTLAIEAGATLQQVQAHARHKNLETTMVYIHQRDRLRDSAADYIHIKK